jgi:alcohol oxidase
MARRMDSFRGEFALEHPQFAAGSPAACIKAEGPVPMSAPDIVYVLFSSLILVSSSHSSDRYSAEDDEAIDRYHRAVGMYIYLSLYVGRRC